jgi:hypothetical protein
MENLSGERTRIGPEDSNDDIRKEEEEEEKSFGYEEV